MKPSRRSLVLGLVNFGGGLAMTSGFQWFYLTASWAGLRPLEPMAATGQVHPFNNHGVLYVSDGDLAASNLLFAVILAAGGLGLACVLIAERMGLRNVLKAAPIALRWRAAILGMQFVPLLVALSIPGSFDTDRNGIAAVAPLLAINVAFSAVAALIASALSARAEAAPAQLP